MRITLPYGLVPGTGFMRSDDKRDSRYNFRAALGQDMPGPLGYGAKFRKDWFEKADLAGTDPAGGLVGGLAPGEL